MVHENPVKLHYYGVEFLISDSSTIWDDTSIILLFLSGPAICLLVGILLNIIIYKQHKRSEKHKIVLIWIILWCYIWFFGGLISGWISKGGLTYFTEWLFDTSSLNPVMAILSIMVLISTGARFKIFIIESSNSIYRIHRDKRKAYFNYSYVMPMLTGIGVFILFKLPAIRINEFILLISFMLYLIPLFNNTKGKPSLKLNKKERKRTRIGFFPLLSAFILLLLFRILLR